MTKKIKIIFVGLAMPGIGLTTVITRLGQNLGNSFEVHLLGYSPTAENLKSEDLPKDIIFHPSPFPANHSITIQSLIKLVTQINPNFVFLIGQPWKIDKLLNNLQPFRDRLKILNYIPIEGKLVKPKAMEALSGVDHCILYTGYAKDNVAQIGKELVKAFPNFKMPKLHVLPHGINCDTFYPLCPPFGNLFQSRIDLRRTLFPKQPELWDAFLVLNANQNYYRKRLDLTLKGFSNFLENHPEVPNAHLYLHLPRLSKYEENKMYKLITALNLNGHVWINAINPDNQILDEPTLNRLYNAADVGVNTAMGEGWGLVSFEHAACGIPQIVPGHTTFKENWEGAAPLLTVCDKEYLYYEFTEMYLICPQSLAQALTKFYFDKEYYQLMAQKAFQKATSSNYQWDRIGVQLAEILRKATTNKNQTELASPSVL